MHLIIGGDSCIGNAIASAWAKAGVPYLSTTRRYENVGPCRPYLDMAADEWGGLDEYCFDAVVFCAAICKMAVCEEDPVYTRHVNVDATLKLAHFLSLRSKYLLFLSSNQVFDGARPLRQAGDPVNPINEYGRQKVDAENGFLQLPNSAILRLTKVIHSELPLLVRWRNELSAGHPIDVYADMFLAPVSIDDVVAKVIAMSAHHEGGLHHLASGLDISYYDFVLQYFMGTHGLGDLVHKVSSPSQYAHRNNSLI